MLYDVRRYVCRPGTIRQHLDLYAAEGWPVQTRHLGQPVFYAVTETGNVNSYLHIWGYADAADRAAKRAALQADPGWQGYLRKSAELGALLSQENSLMTDAPFFTPPAR
jgi:hypothetical protein